MTIQRWARWVEFGEDNLDPNEVLDIQDVPVLYELFKNKFFQGDKEHRLYSNLIEIVKEFLPAPLLGFGYGRELESFYKDSYTQGFFSRLEVLPLRDGNISMTAQGFRIALIGKKAFDHPGRFYQSVFYDLKLEEKKYVIEKQPDLFPFKTNLPQKIGSGSLLGVLADHTPKDLLIDAALFGADALLEAIKLLKEMIPQLCIEEGDQLEKILCFYSTSDRNSLAGRLIFHQIDIIKERQIDHQDLLELVDCLNSYCAQTDAEIELYALIFPGHSFKRSYAILSWLKNSYYKTEIVHIPLSPITKIICANHLELGPLEHDPYLLVKEFDFLTFDEKKEFILKIILAKKIEALPHHYRISFLYEIEKRCGQPLNILFKLALQSIGFSYVNPFGQNVLLRFEHRELLSDIQSLNEVNKKWFLENFLTHDACLIFYFQSDKLALFFNIINELRSSLTSSYLSSFDAIVEEKILQFCPAYCVKFALSNLGRGYKLANSLKKYVLKKIATGTFDENLALICKKFFDFDENNINLLLFIAILQYPSGEFLINDPDFFLAVPDKFKPDIQLLLELLKPLESNAADPLVGHLKMLPKGLKEILVKENAFSIFFQKEVMERLLNLYKEGCIPDEEMFFIASRLPYETFKEINDKLSLDFSDFSKQIWFAGYEDTIQNHLQDLSLKITFADPYSEEDLSQFINSIAHLSIGEGRWIQYLACRVPCLFSEADIKNIINYIPMNLIPYMAHTIDPLHRKWLLDTRFEAVFSKNIDRLSVEVRAWLFDNLNSWFPICLDIIEKIQDLWKRPRKSFEQKLEIFEETQTLIILFNKRCLELHSICQRLAKQPDAQKAQSVYQQLEPIRLITSQWLQKIENIDLFPISDALTQELLKGEVYSLEGNGWILKKTKERLKENPFNRRIFKSEAEKDQRVPLLTSAEITELKERRQTIALEIESFRDCMLEFKP